MRQTERAGLWAQGLLLGGLVLLPHQAFLHSLFALEILGKNFWLVFFLGLSLLSMVMVVVLSGGVRERRALLVAALLWALGGWSGLYWPEANIVEVVVNTRPLFMLPLALLAGRVAAGDACFQQRLLLLIIAQGVLQSVVGLLHISLFPQVVTGTFAHLRGLAFFVSDEWPLYTSREAGTLGNPSAYAEIIVLGAFASCYFLTGRKYRLSMPNDWVQFLAVWLLLMVAVVPSLSRVSLVFVSLPFLVVLQMHLGCNSPTDRRLLLVLVCLVSVVVLLMLWLQYPQFITRFRAEGMYGRTQKNALMTWSLVADASYFIYGLPAELIRSLRTPEGMQFGDNSFLRLAAASGVPVFCAWCLLIARITGWGRMHDIGFVLKSRLNWCLLVYLLLLLYLGDVLFNDGWLLMIALLLASQWPALQAACLQDQATKISAKGSSI